MTFRVLRPVTTFKVYAPGRLLGFTVYAYVLCLCFMVMFYVYVFVQCLFVCFMFMCYVLRYVYGMRYVLWLLFRVFCFMFYVYVLCYVYGCCFTFVCVCVCFCLCLCVMCHV